MAVLKHTQTLDELESLVGLTEVKNFVTGLVNQLEVNLEREKYGQEITFTPTLNMIFQGNPGTGKTTVARIVAKLLKELGVLETDTVVEIGRTWLIEGPYQKPDFENIKQVIKDAKGGVIFIDYSYGVRINNDLFYRDAVNTLIEGIEDTTVVILSGYIREINGIMEEDHILKSHFSNVVAFPDYTSEELLAITKKFIYSNNFILSSAAEDTVIKIFQDKKITDFYYANARFAPDLFENAVRNQTFRLAKMKNKTEDDYRLLLPEDFNFDKESK